MRIYTIEKMEVPKNWGWDRCYKIVFNKESIPDATELIRWCHRASKDDFVYHWLVMEFSERSLTHSISHIKFWYELRCSAKIGDLFEKVWSIPSDELERNLEYLRELDQRAAGWTKVNGEQIPISEVVKGYLANETSTSKVRKKQTKAQKRRVAKSSRKRR